MGVRSVARIIDRAGPDRGIQTDTHVHLGERNKPWDRVKRIGATLLLLQHAGHAIFWELGFDPDEWDDAAAEAEEEIEVICAPYYKALEEEPL